MLDLGRVKTKKKNFVNFKVMIPNTKKNSCSQNIKIFTEGYTYKNVANELLGILIISEHDNHCLSLFFSKCSTIPKFRTSP